MSEVIAQQLPPLIAGWTGTHFQRVAASIRANPTLAEFDKMLSQHDEVAGLLSARYPAQFSFPLFGDCKRRSDYSDPYVAEILALRALLPANDDDAFARGRNGLYPRDARLETALTILDAGLTSAWFKDKTHDAMKAEMLHWKLVLMVSLHAFRWRQNPGAKYAYARVKADARNVMKPLGIEGKLLQLEARYEVNAGYRP